MIVPIQHFLRRCSLNSKQFFLYKKDGIRNIGYVYRNLCSEINSNKIPEAVPKESFDLNQNPKTDLISTINNVKNALINLPDIPANVETTITSDRVGIIKFNSVNSAVNILSMDMMQKIHQSLVTLNQSPDVDIIVLRSSNADSFFAGADINMIDSLPADKMVLASQSFQEFNKFIIDSCKPTVAMVEGHCLGGGLEVALACTFCIAPKPSKVSFGFPEVKLGMLPGGLGTYLSFSKCAHTPILEMLVTGKSVNVDEAYKIGIVSHVYLNPNPISKIFPKDESSILKILDINAKTAKIVKENSELATSQSLYSSWENPRNLGAYLKKKYITEYLTGKFLVSTFMFRENILKKTIGLFPAPLNILSLYSMFLKHSYDLQKYREDYINAEAMLFGNLASSPESQLLREIYLKKKAINNQYISKAPVSKTIKHVSILGSGLMGIGIADVSLNKANYNVTVKDVSTTSIVNAGREMMKLINAKVKNKRLNNYDVSQLMNNLKFTTKYEDIRKSDIVIEAVPEILKLKQEIIREVEKVISPNCIIASNTSAISISEIAEASTRPQNVIGMHYFSPVQKMELLEIVMGKETSQEALALALQVGKKQGKTCIVVKDSPGFFTTRVLGSSLAELLDLVEDGYSPEIVDAEFKDFGFPTGAYALMDEVGLDTTLHIIEFLSQKLGPRFNTMRNNFLTHLTKDGCFGRKVGKGIYKYDEEKSRGCFTIPSTEFFQYFSWLDVFVEADPPVCDIMPRLTSRILNESCRCLEEGVIESPEVGDLASVFGIGFPVHLKGPFSYIDQISPKVVIENLKKYQNDKNSAAFEPCNLLLDMAKNGKKFFPHSSPSLNK